MFLFLCKGDGMGQIQNPPKPKGKCNLGSQIALYGNHFAFKLDNDLTIFQYDVTVKKEVFNKKKNVNEKIEIKAKQVMK